VQRFGDCHGSQGSSVEWLRVRRLNVPSELGHFPEVVVTRVKAAIGLNPAREEMGNVAFYNS
jgi:hypothetical protein